MATIKLRKTGWHVLRFVMLLLFVSGSFALSNAQSATSLAVHDRVIATQLVFVHVRPDAARDIVTDVLPGMASRILATKFDSEGQEWAYLENNALGWIPLSLNGAPTLTLYSDAQLEQMTEQATVLLDSDATNLDAYIMRGAVSLTQKNYEAALLDFTAAIELSPEEGRLYEYRGKVHLDAENYELALVDFDQAVALGRELANTYNRRGIAHENLGHWDDALVEYNRAIEIAPDYGILYNNIGNIYVDLNSYQRGWSEYTRAIEIDPYLAAAYGNRGLLYEELSTYEESLEDLNTALEINPYDSDFYVYRAIYYMGVYGDLDAAFADYTRAIEVDPTNGYAYAQRGVGYIYRGDINSAVDDLKEATRLDPTYEHSYYTLGFLYGELGRYEDALASYTWVIDNGIRYGYSSLLFRAQIYAALGDYENGLGDIAVYLLDTQERDYFVTSAYLVRGYIYIAQGDYIAARRSYETAMGLQPEFTAAFSAYGDGYRVAPLRENQTIELQNQLNQDRNQPALWRELAVLYSEVGRWEEAAYALQEYVRISGGNVDLSGDIAALIQTLKSLSQSTF